MIRILKFTPLVFLLLIGIANGDVVHDESVDGDLSGAFASPTALNFSVGDNTIIGDIGTNGNGGATNGNDADYFTIVVEAGETLDSINVDSRSGAGQSFFAYTAGSAFTGQGGGDIDGSVLFSNSSGEVLDDLLGAPGSLGPGSYSFWIQETATGVVDYQFTFRVTSAVPEPSTLGVLGLMLIGTTARRRRSS